MPLIIYEKTDHIAKITLNNPDELNAMTVEMGELFQDTLAKIKKDSQIRCVIVTGAGRAFSSGGNFAMLQEKLSKTPEENARDLKAFYQLFLAVRELPQPVIAQINGHAVGAGFCFSLACDLRYASDKAKMGANFARIGLAPGMGGTKLITELAGPVYASEILLLGDIFTAQKAKEFGLLNEVYSAEDLPAKVMSVANTIANNGPLAVRQIKIGIQKAKSENLENMFDYDATSQAKCFATEDIKEGISAVMDKRPAQFKDK